MDTVGNYPNVASETSNQTGTINASLDISSNIPIVSLVAFGSSVNVISTPCPTKSVNPNKLLFNDISFLYKMYIFQNKF